MPDNPPKPKSEASAESSPTFPQTPPAQTTVVSGLPAPADTALPHIPNYDLLRCIGRGAYGEVWVARSVVGAFHAVKIVYRKSFETERPYDREFAGIQKFEPISRSHPGLVNILHVGRNDQAGYFYYVMELADAAEPRVTSNQCSVISGQSSPTSETTPLNTEHWSLNTYTPRTLASDLKRHSRLPPNDCIQIGLALTRALGYLHEQGLVHRDIKPANIIFVRGAPKLADIGLVCGTEGTVSYVGTEGYIPPEGPGTTQADIYSLGKVLYEMSTGKDRTAFPDLPTDLRGESAERKALLELNEVLVKACAGDVKQRYQSAPEMEAELALLQSGQSVKGQRAQRQRWALAKRAAMVASIAALVLAPLAFLQMRSSHRQAATLDQIQSIAVLKFDNRSSDKEDEYFSEGLSDEIRAVLLKVPGLKVASPTSTFAAQKQSGDIQKIGERLNVSTVLEGSVTRRGSRLHILWQLTSAADGFSLKTDGYDGPWTSDVIEIQGKVALQVAAALGLKLPPAEQRQIKKLPTEKVEAWTNYLHARYYSRSDRRGEETNNAMAISMLERAVKLDTNFALAYAELGRAYVDRYFFYRPTEKEWETNAQFVIERALSLDGNLAEAHLAQAAYFWTPSQKFPHEKAVLALQRTLELDPQSEEALDTLALVFNHMGLLDQALEVASQSELVNPLATGWRFCKGNALLWKGKYESALKELSDMPFALQLIGASYRAWALFQLGKTNEAKAEIDTLSKNGLQDRGGLLASVQAMLHAKAGEREKAQEQLNNAINQRKGFGHFHHAEYNIASAFALMGDHTNAIIWFKQSVDEGFNCYPLFTNDHNLDVLRGDKDFQALMRSEEKKYNGYKRDFGTGSPLGGRK